MDGDTAHSIALRCCWLRFALSAGSAIRTACGTAIGTTWENDSAIDWRFSCIDGGICPVGTSADWTGNDSGGGNPAAVGLS